MEIANISRSILFCCIILLLSFSSKISCQEEHGARIGGAKRDAGTGIILDSSGDLIISGTTRSYGNGGDDIILVKMDLDGNVILQETYNWEHHGRAYGIEEAMDGNYVIVGEVWDYGYGREDIFLMKVDQNGQKIWEKYYGGYHTDQGFDVKRMEDGFIALGYTSSQPGTTRGNFYLVRTDTEGNLLWENNYGTEFLDFGFCVVPSGSGEFWLLGAAGGFFNPARADFMNPDSDMLLIKTDSNGEEITRSYFGGTLHDWGKDMILSDDGSLYIIGSTQSKGSGSFDMYLLKVGPLGNMLWEKTFGGMDFEYGNSIGIDPAGNIYLAGTKQLPDSENGPDLYIVKTNPDGELLWEQSIGGYGSDYGYDLVCMPDSSCVIVGEMENTETKLTDIYVIRLDQNGNLIGFKPPQDNIQLDAVKIFPNPVTDIASIEWEALPPPGGYKLLIFSLSGQIIESREYGSEKKITVDFQNLPQGNYLYQIIYSGKSLTGQFTTR